MKMHDITKRFGIMAVTAAIVLLVGGALVAQDVPPPPTGDKPAGDSAEPAKPATEAGLAGEQNQIAQRFRDLEKLILRMAELTAPTDPRRAALLQQAVAMSKERDIEHQFQALVDLLRQERLAAVVKNQGEVQQDLVKLLELLLSEDRGKRIESEKERIRDYLKRVNKIIKEQKGIKGETARGGDARKLSDQQSDLAEKTEQLSDDVKQDNAKSAPEDSSKDEKPADGKESKPGDGSQPKDGEDSKGGDGEKKDADKGEKDGEKNDKKDKDKKDGDKKDADDKQADRKPKDGDDSKDKDGKSESDGEKKPSDGKPNDGKPMDGKDGKPSDGKPVDKPGDQQPGGQPQDQPPMDGQPRPGGKGGDEPPPPQPKNDNPAQKRLEEAQKRMKEAEEKLKEAKREDATEKQAEAIKELEQAKADLEEILRQLREEEMARTLAQLEARFRKMLDQQVEVYVGTRRLDKVPEAERDRDDEIESGRLSRKETEIIAEADKALAVLKEEGSAVAFPEAVSEMREDMEQVRLRLAEAKVGDMTQGIEKDVIAALEEMIASLKKAQKDMENKGKQGEPAPGGEDGDPPLVDTISELKMIRALQMRVNQRTQRYAELTPTEQTDTPELLEALARLAEREERIHKITRDIVVGRNK